MVMTPRSADRHPDFSHSRLSCHRVLHSSRNSPMVRALDCQPGGGARAGSGSHSSLWELFVLVGATSPCGSHLSLWGATCPCGSRFSGDGCLPRTGPVPRIAAEAAPTGVSTRAPTRVLTRALTRSHKDCLLRAVRSRPRGGSLFRGTNRRL